MVKCFIKLFVKSINQFLIDLAKQLYIKYIFFNKYSK